MIIDDIVYFPGAERFKDWSACAPADQSNNSKYRPGPFELACPTPVRTYLSWIAVCIPLFQTCSCASDACSAHGPAEDWCISLAGCGECKHDLLQYLTSKHIRGSNLPCNEAWSHGTYPRHVWITILSYGKHVLLGTAHL